MPGAVPRARGRRRLDARRSRDGAVPMSPIGRGTRGLPVLEVARPRQAHRRVAARRAVPREDGGRPAATGSDAADVHRPVDRHVTGTHRASTHSRARPQCDWTRRDRARPPDRMVGAAGNPVGRGPRRPGRRARGARPRRTARPDDRPGRERGGAGLRGVGGPDDSLAEARSTRCAPTGSAPTAPRARRHRCSTSSRPRERASRP
jgi:hypothetical protein